MPLNARTRRAAGTGSKVTVGHKTVDPLAEKGVPWSATSYPAPDPALDFIGERACTESTERLYWRRDGRLAYRAGVMVPDDERALLCTQDELKDLPR